MTGLTKRSSTRGESSYFLCNATTLLLLAVLYNVNCGRGDKMIEQAQVVVSGVLLLASFVLSFEAKHVLFSKRSLARTTARLAAARAIAIFVRDLVLAMIAVDLAYFYLDGKRSPEEAEDLWDASRYLWELGVVVRLPLLLTAVVMRIRTGDYFGVNRKRSRIKTIARKNLDVVTNIAVAWLLLTYALGIRGYAPALFFIGYLLFLPMAAFVAFIVSYRRVRSKRPDLQPTESLSLAILTSRLGLACLALALTVVILRLIC
ncbi:MAG: hypothetical protein IJU03_09195 [Thermoguttaceae bacterium]|nr:hypothetical protein [Thermoguttaceae bacterium]